MKGKVMENNENIQRTAVITGAGRGIGKATAIAFAAKGYDVVINYAGNETAAAQTAKECETQGVRTLVIKADVSKKEEVEQLFAQTIEQFGRVDVLVNNAGITRDNLLMRMPEEDFDAVIATNLKGAYLCMQSAFRYMMKQRYGRIVNISSVVGVHGNAGQVNYSASKAGLIGMTKSAAKEFASRKITVNAVAPGFIETDMSAVLADKVKDGIMSGIPLGCFGKAEDVAGAVVYLASEEAYYITGQVLGVDGGMGM